MWQFWIIVSGIFFIGEIMTVGFLLFWFALGALLAMVVSFFTDNIIIQTSVFVISSGLLTLLTRKFANKFSVKKEDEKVTNAFSIISKTGIVTQEIDPISESGQIKVGTEIWSAKSNSSDKIAKGTQVEVLEIDGVKAVVTPIYSKIKN